MRDIIVCDVGFGDSGKGMVVDNLCSSDSLIVRFSGGQQCGHTVIREGIKHTFSSFGSGTLKGCPTFFTEDTTFYLNSLNTEYEILKGKGVDSRLYLHPLVKATTPYDVIANRIGRKGKTCGTGVGSTMKRNEGPYKLYAQDFFAPPAYFRERLQVIKDYYFNQIHDFADYCWLYQDEINQFIEYALETKPFTITGINSIPHSRKVFEGSQGILLDMDHGIFPNVTFANTTSKNAWKYTQEAEICYVSRCYQTRHGHGWMSNQQPISLINNDEEINTYNEWQGEFRIGELDYEMINYAINIDKIYSRDSDKCLIVSCLDQRPDFVLDRSKIDDTLHLFGNNSAHCGHLHRI